MNKMPDNSASNNYAHLGFLNMQSTQENKNFSLGRVLAVPSSRRHRKSSREASQKLKVNLARRARLVSPF